MSREPEWRTAVRVLDEPDLARELTDRCGQASGLRSVGVTDLLAARPAFWRLAAPPVRVTAEREARMRSGRTWHRRLGEALAAEGQLEVRVRRDGIVGRLDALTDRPIEVKTASLAVGPELLLAERPEYAEQLAMYCALLGRPDGRILVLEVRDREVGAVRALDVRFRRPGVLLEEMRRRAAALRAAWDARRPEGLARCPWYDRGCEYRQSGTCDCGGNEPIESDALRREVEAVDAVPSEEARLRERLSAEPVPVSSYPIARFREIVYPRRAFFERSRPPPPPEPWASPLERDPGSYSRWAEAVESGPVGEVARLPSRAEEPEEDVTGFRGAPYLLRSSAARVPPTSAELVGRFPQYVLELGFKCVVTGTNVARAIIAYEHPAPSSDRLRVFRIELTSPATFARLWRRRSSALERALRSGAPLDLPACPAWMFDRCPYRGECGCASAPERSQR